MKRNTEKLMTENRELNLKSENRIFDFFLSVFKTYIFNICLQLSVICLLFNILISPLYAQENIIGNIEPPGWLKKHGSVEVGENFGLINFFSNVLRLITVVAGLYGVLNLILAGTAFISSQGDQEKIQNAQSKIWNSLNGLILIAASFTIAGIIGWIFFGDPRMIISPKIYGPEGGS